jgi:hypothetical protein
MVMLYGEKKTRQMMRDGLVCRGKNRSPRSRAIEKAILRQYLDGDEDADIRFDVFHYEWKRDWDAYACCTRTTSKWAVQITKELPDPDSRFGRLRALTGDGFAGHRICRWVRHQEEFCTDVLSWCRYPHVSKEEREAREKAWREEQHARRVRLLREIVETGWGHRLLTRSMSHKTITWPVWREQVPTQKYDGGQRKNITVYEDRFVDTPMGPTEPRKLTGLGDIEDFLRDLYKAASAPYHVKAEVPYIEREVRPNRYYYGKREHLSRHTYNVENIHTTRPNPEKHPEWFESVGKFLDVWEETQGNPGKLRQYVQKGRF